MTEYIDVTNERTICYLDDEKESTKIEINKQTVPSLSFCDSVFTEKSPEHSPKQIVWKGSNRKGETRDDCNYYKSYDAKNNHEQFY